MDSGGFNDACSAYTAADRIKMQRYMRYIYARIPYIRYIYARIPYTPYRIRVDIMTLASVLDADATDAGTDQRKSRLPEVVLLHSRVQSRLSPEERLHQKKQKKIKQVVSGGAPGTKLFWNHGPQAFKPTATLWYL